MGRAFDTLTAVVSRSSEYTYTPAWWVPGAHLQTLWGKLVRRPPVVATRTERWATPDDDELEIRRLDPPASAGPRTPRLLVLHGLEGTIRSHYLRGLLDQGRRRGWAVDVLIFRGCNGEVPRARRLYHSGETTDLDFVVRRLVDEHPMEPLVVIGVSLGGNVLLKWLGEQGEDAPAPLRAAAVVSVPFDLARGSRHIERGFSRLYTRHFLRTLRKKALAKLAHHPRLFDEGRLRHARTLSDFDDAVTAPLHGFAGASDYYERSSSIRFLQAIRRPTLLLSAYDDPFLPRDILESVARLARDNDQLIAEFHPRGGHAGFVSGRVPWRAHYYAEERAVQFLDDHLERILPQEHRTCPASSGLPSVPR
jgi:predicted alpha/beta-fold hydrolase